MITCKGRSPEVSECGTSLEQLRRIKKELSYYQELSNRLSEEIKHLANSKSETLKELRLQHEEFRQVEQFSAQLKQELLQKQIELEELKGRVAESQQRCQRHQRLNDRLKRERSDMQLEHARLMEQLTRAEQAANKTIIIGGDSRLDRQPTRHNEAENETQSLSRKIEELTCQLQRCQSAQAFPEQPHNQNERFILKYERAKYEISRLKSQLRTQRKEAAVVIGNLQSQHDSMRCQLESEKVSAQKLILRNLQLTEHIKDLNSRLDRTLSSLAELERASQNTLQQNSQMHDKLRELQLSHIKLLKFNEDTQQDLSGQLQKVAEVMRSLMEEKDALERRNERLTKQLRSRNRSSDYQG